MADGPTNPVVCTQSLVRYRGVDPTVMEQWSRGIVYWSHGIVNAIRGPCGLPYTALDVIECSSRLMHERHSLYLTVPFVSAK